MARRYRHRSNGRSRKLFLRQIWRTQRIAIARRPPHGHRAALSRDRPFARDLCTGPGHPPDPPPLSRTAFCRAGEGGPRGAGTACAMPCFLPGRTGTAPWGTQSHPRPAREDYMSGVRVHAVAWSGRTGQSAPLRYPGDDFAVSAGAVEDKRRVGSLGNGFRGVVTRRHGTGWDRSLRPRRCGTAIDSCRSRAGLFRTRPLARSCVVRSVPQPAGPGLSARRPFRRGNVGGNPGSRAPTADRVLLLAKLRMAGLARVLAQGLERTAGCPAVARDRHVGERIGQLYKLHQFGLEFQ